MHENAIAAMKDLYGAEIEVCHSSSAGGEFFVITIKGGCIKNNDGFSHLSIPQLKLLKLMIKAALAEVEQDE